MSYDALMMMVIVLIVNWGGFVAMLVYGIRREARKDKSTAVLRHGAGSDITTI